MDSVTAKVCSIEDCGRKAVARGFCDKHYRRHRKTNPAHEKNRKCSHPGCGRKYCANGLCSAHSQQKRLGKPLVPVQIRNNLLLRFWSRVNKDGPVHPILKTKCWLWTGGHQPFGHGSFSDKGINIAAHRFSFILFFGEIPKTKNPLDNCICHKCDNPPCVNPEHLFLGSNAENLADMRNKGRRAKGEQINASVFADDDVRLIRKRVSAGEGFRALGREFGVSHGAISNIYYRKTWKHVK